MSGSRLAALSLCLAGCSEVRIEDGTGGSAQGPTASSSASDTVTSSSATAGGGGSGGAAPLPVAGCEALVPVGDPVVVSSLNRSHLPALVQMDAQRFGLLYLDLSSGGHLLSRVISNPFDGWPPGIGDQVEHVTEYRTGYLGTATVGPNGTFTAASWPHHGVGVFGQPGFVEWGGRVFLEPGGPGAYSLAYVDAETNELRYHPAGESDVYQVVAVVSACVTNVGFTDTDALLLARREVAACDTMSATESFLQVSSGVVTNGGAIDTPFISDRNRLLPRTGGAWYVSDGAFAGLDLQAIDALGNPVGARFVFDGVSEGDATAFIGPWREGGFAVAQQTPLAAHYDLTVSDGFGQTIAPAVPVPGLLDTQNLAIVGSADGRGVMLAYVALDGIALLRADCHSLEN